MHKSPEPLQESPLPLARLKYAGAYSAPRGRDFPPHDHAVWELVYYLSGHIRLHVEEEVYHPRAGTLACIPPHATHWETATTAYSHRFLWIALPKDIALPPVCMDDGDRALGHIVRRLGRERDAQNAHRTEMIEALLTQLLIQVRRAEDASPPTEREAAVFRAERLLEEGFATGITIAQVAREVGVSPSSLRAHFQAVRGLSPKACMVAVRVRSALALIRDTDLNLETIAGLCGYDSPSHLSREIKRETGLPPGALRHERHIGPA